MTIRLLILSDTHDTAFPDPSELPKTDVVLHCGDLTMIGGLSKYRAAIEKLVKCKAELKLVIPGNHDVSLDPKWWADNLGVEDGDDPEEPQKAFALFDATTARYAGVRLLTEGLHTFTLNDGRSFTIYASPFTPAFGGYAFAYSLEQPKFNEHTIPTDVDIVMTHVPPQKPRRGDYRLDLNKEGMNCGCPALWKAIESARPRLHCFGHIHEGYGNQLINMERGWS